MSATTVQKLLWVDSTLELLAAMRREAAVADNIGEAENIDTKWKEYDELRQQFTASASDRELIEYEEQRFISLSRQARQ